MDLTVNGRKAYAYTGGKPFDPKLPAVVFIHGAEHDHCVWTLQTRYLAHHGRGVLAVDLPGHGRSDGPPLASVEEMAECAALLARWPELRARAAGAELDRPAAVRSRSR